MFSSSMLEWADDNYLIPNGVAISSSNYHQNKLVYNLAVNYTLRPVAINQNNLRPTVDQGIIFEFNYNTVITH